MKKTGRFLRIISCSLLALNLSAATAQERLSIDVQSYCRKTYGDAATFAQVRRDAYSWRCTLRGREYVVEMNEVCKSQHGEAYSAQLTDPKDSFTWYCARQ
jgi:hypothetical protein